MSLIQTEDALYVASELSKRTGENVNVNTIRTSISPKSAGKLIAVVEIGKEIVSGEGHSINELINSVYERYTA